MKVLLSEYISDNSIFRFLEFLDVYKTLFVWTVLKKDSVISCVDYWIGLNILNCRESKRIKEIGDL